MADLSGSTAVVTGAARGIGQAIAERLADDGAHIVVTDIRDGTGTVDLITDRGGTAEYREGDVTDAASMDDVFSDLDVDVLVNDAAYFAPLVTDRKRFDEISEEEWETVMDVNVKGIFLACKSALPQFNDGASIVNISSGTVIRGVSGFLHYVTSKAAVVGMTRAMATEVGGLGVRVNAVMPGFTASEAGLQAGEEAFESRLDDQAIARRLEPADIANAVSFLAGADSGMVSGQVLLVDGGRGFY